MDDQLLGIPIRDWLKVKRYCDRNGITPSELIDILREIEDENKIDFARFARELSENLKHPDG